MGVIFIIELKALTWNEIVKKGIFIVQNDYFLIIRLIMHSYKQKSVCVRTRANACAYMSIHALMSVCVCVCMYVCVCVCVLSPKLSIDLGEITDYSIYPRLAQNHMNLLNPLIQAD